MELVQKVPLHKWNSRQKQAVGAWITYIQMKKVQLLVYVVGLWGRQARPVANRTTKQIFPA